MERKMILKGGGVELVLPVTPESYQVENGVNVEMVNIHELGDAILTGYGTLATVKLSCLFPANDYPFSRGSDPDRYIDRLNHWVNSKARLRFVVSGTGINLPVVIQSFAYGERDGTNDIYADLVLREYRKLQAIKTVAPPTANKPRGPAEVPPESLPETYQMRPEDTVRSVSRKLLGNPDFADLLKTASGITDGIAIAAFTLPTLNIKKAMELVKNRKKES